MGTGSLFRLGALCAVLCLYLTACGSDDDEPETGDEGGADAGADPIDSGDGDGEGDDGPGDGNQAIPTNVEERNANIFNEDGTSKHFGGCDLDTGYAGDDKCLRAPEPHVGFQIHVGPDGYSDEEVADWLMQPGSESSECYFFETENDEEFFYQVWELSGRDGTHHIINSQLINGQAEGWGGCMDQGLGTSPNVAGILPGASRAYMKPAPVAPENANLGATLGANVPVQADMHYFNFMSPCDDKSCLVLREFWLNVYFVPESEVQERSSGIRGMGGLDWLLFPIQPGTHETYRYECPVESDGRIIRLIGHTHKHGVRETAWIRRPGDETDDDMLKVFEQFDYLEPQIFEYDSLTENPDFAPGMAGAFSGMLEVKAGDTLVWECEINNTSDVALRYTNEVETGEMCNIWGQVVGPTMDCVVFF